VAITDPKTGDDMKYYTPFAAAVGLLVAACAGQQTTERQASQTDAPPPANQSQATAPSSGESEQLCEGFGPQTPRDITNAAGQNTDSFPLAPSPSELNLCNIHTHT
jgi:hypothetical protein